MEYLTIFIRWCCIPLQHINFITEEIANWHVSRWTFEARHLTVICVQVASNYAVTYKRRLMSQIKNMWVESSHNLMDTGFLETLLKDKAMLHMYVNIFAAMHTNVTSGGTFYQHVDKIETLVNGHNWTINTDLTIADERTMYLMCCRHVSTFACVSGQWTFHLAKFKVVEEFRVKQNKFTLYHMHRQKT